MSHLVKRADDNRPLKAELGIAHETACGRRNERDADIGTVDRPFLVVTLVCAFRRAGARSE